jgi:hypothetical protein
MRRREEPRLIVDAQSRPMLIVRQTVAAFNMTPHSTTPAEAANESLLKGKWRPETNNKRNCRLVPPRHYDYQLNISGDWR